MRYLSLFSGIGSPEQALKNLGIAFELVGFSEIDKFAIKSYCEIHETNEGLNLGDITKINIENLPVGIDLITHGSPCQDFSIAGKGMGGNKDSGTRSSLMWNTVAICEHCKPRYVIWENVKNVLSKRHKHNFDKYIDEMNRLGYNNYYKVLNAKDYGVPQNRERVFIVSIRKDIKKEFNFPKPFDNGIRLKDILEEEVEEKYYINTESSFKLIEEFKRTNKKLSLNNDNELIQLGTLDIKGNEQIKRVYSDKGLSPCLNTMEGGNRQPKILKVREATKKGYSLATVGDSINLEQPNSVTRRGRVGKQVANTLNTFCNQAAVVEEKEVRIRKLTPKECWRLMGFKDEQFNKAKRVNSNSQLYKQAGNSIVVDVMEEIFKNLF